MKLLWEMWAKQHISILRMNTNKLVDELYYVSLQFNARVTADITLVHKSCPAGFDIVEWIIPGLYVCRCSMQDANILSCNRSSEHVLLQVRASVWYACDKWIAGCPPRPVHEMCHYVIPPNHCLTPPLSSMHFPAHFTYFSPNQCRTGCGALLSPTQMVTESFSAQAVPMVTAAASLGM